MSFGYQVLGFGAGSSAAPVTLETGGTRNAAPSETDASSYTFSSIDFGTAAANRHVIAVGGWEHSTSGTTDPSSVTIGGVTATKVATKNDGRYDRSFMYIAAVPTGTSGALVVNLPVTAWRCGMGCMSIYGASITPTATGTDSGVSGSEDLEVSIAVSAGGVIVGVAENNTATGGYTWVGIDEIWDEVEASLCVGGAAKTFAAAATVAVQANLASTNGATLCVAAFGPA
tara:strand:+ start:913 stop:1599 length:687 start_codon:yes stop_codon:yes gene_type:complete